MKTCDSRIDTQTPAFFVTYRKKYPVNIRKLKKTIIIKVIFEHK